MQTKVKFCGFTNLSEAMIAIELGVDYLGFIVEVEGSKRSIDLNTYFAYVNFLSEVDSDVKIVAVLVDPLKEMIDSIMRNTQTDVIQLHGNESPLFCELFKGKIEIWKAIKVRGKVGQEKIEEVLRYRGVVDRILLDTAKLEDKVQETQSKRFNSFEFYKALENEGIDLVLSGGINVDNVEDYVEKLEPEIIDLASGVEDSPGKKNIEKMQQFLEKVRMENDTSP